jgi:hypothetical protein
VTRRRRLGAALGAVLFAAGGAAADARAADPELDAKLTCEPARAPGRVVCALDVSAPAARRLVWADALILETPPFARALRARVSGRELGASQSSVRLPLALVLEGPGRGQVRVRARAVLCAGQGPRERCAPATRDSSVELVAAR